MIKKGLLSGLILLISLLSFAEQTPSVMANKASESLLIDIDALNDGKLVAVGERGHVLISEDNGVSWRQVITPSRAMLTAVSFVDENTGYAVGHQQVILKTTDGGETWEMQHEASDDFEFPALMDVWFRDSQWGVAIGAYGLYLHTEDGGENWESIHLSDVEDPEFGLPHLYSIAYDSRNELLYMAGELGFIVVSEDDGLSWRKLESPYQGSFFGVAVSPNGSVHLMGLRGHLFRSEDKGETWTEIETNTNASINSMISVGGSQLIYFAVDGVMLTSKDDGRNVDKIERSDRNGLLSSVLTGVNRLVVVGEKGTKIINFDGQDIKE